jgi:hypothetical protein
MVVKSLHQKFARQTEQKVASRRPVRSGGNGLAKTPLAKVKEPAESLAPVLEQVRAHSAIWRSIDLIGERFVTVGRFRKWVKPLTMNDFQQFQRLIRFDP